MSYVPYGRSSLGHWEYPADQFPIGTLIYLKCGCVERIRKIYPSGTVTVELKVTCSPDHADQFYRRSSLITDTAIRIHYKATELSDNQFYLLPYQWSDDYTIFNRGVN